MIDKLSNWFSDLVEGLTPKHVFLFILAVEVVVVWSLWDKENSAQGIAAKIAIASFFYWTIARFARRLITATRHWHPIESTRADPLDFDQSKEILIGEKERCKLKGVFDSIQNLLPEFHKKHRSFFEDVLEKNSIGGHLSLQLHDLIQGAEEQVDYAMHLTSKRKLRGTRFLRCARMYLFVEVVSSYKRDRLPIFHYLLGIPTLYDQQEEDCL